MNPDSAMTSVVDPGWPVSPAPILWITGLAGTGKSTLARAVVAALRRDGARPLLLDGDELRRSLDAAEEETDHRPSTRLRRAWRVARLARMASQQGIPVVVATISLLHAVHAWNRDGDSPYAEVLLEADPHQLRQRRPALYGSTASAGAVDVVGVDLVAEFPLRPDLVLPPRDDDDIDSWLQSVNALWARLAASGSQHGR